MEPSFAATSHSAVRKSCEAGMARKRTCGTQTSKAKPQMMHWTSKLLLLTLVILLILCISFLSSLTFWSKTHQEEKSLHWLMQGGRDGGVLLTHSRCTNPLSIWCTVVSSGPEGKVWRAALLQLPATSHLWSPNCTCHFDYDGRDKGHSRESYPTFLTYCQGEQHVLQGPHQNVWITYTRGIQLQAKTKMRCSSTRSLSPLWDNFK